MRPMSQSVGAKGKKAPNSKWGEKKSRENHGSRFTIVLSRWDLIQFEFIRDSRKSLMGCKKKKKHALVIQQRPTRGWAFILINIFPTFLLLLLLFIIIIVIMILLDFAYVVVKKPNFTSQCIITISIIVLHIP